MDNLIENKTNRLNFFTKYEIIGLITKMNTIYKNGGYSLINQHVLEHKYGIKLYDNTSVVNEATAAILTMMLCKCPIYVKKDKTLIKRYVYGDLNTSPSNIYYCYYIILKDIIRTFNGNTSIVNTDTLKKIYPIFMANILNNNLSVEEITELNEVCKDL